MTAIAVSALARPGGSNRFDGAKSMTGFIPAPIKPEITMDHLEKVDIRAGLIERVELVPTSSKLVRLTVNFGDRRRTVLAGLRGERADPKAEIEGCQALFVVNLPARPIAGEISEVMLFDRDATRRSPAIARPPGDGTPPPVRYPRCAPYWRTPRRGNAPQARSSWSCVASSRGLNN